MKFWMTAAALLCLVLPAEAKKIRTPKSAHAARYSSRKAPKVRSHKGSVSKNRFRNKVN